MDGNLAGGWCKHINEDSDYTKLLRTAEDSILMLDGDNIAKLIMNVEVAIKKDKVVRQLAGVTAIEDFCGMDDVLIKYAAVLQVELELLKVLGPKQDRPAGLRTGVVGAIKKLRAYKLKDKKVVPYMLFAEAHEVLTTDYESPKPAAAEIAEAQ